MPAYTIDYCDQHLDELLDKMGSDYFPLQVKIGRFVTFTYDFIREHTKAFEATQEISDDIKPLLIRNDIVLSATEGLAVFQAPEPINYFRLISLVPFILGEGNQRIFKAKVTRIIKEGQRLVYGRDAFRKPSPSYPHVLRISNFFEIRVGNFNTDNYNRAEISYIKKPTFGNIDNDDDIIVNLPDAAIEQIMLKTAESLRFTTGDDSARDIYQFDQTFGKRNK